MLGLSKLLRFAKRLQGVSDFDELLDLALREMQTLGYSNVWVLSSDGASEYLRLHTLKSDGGRTIQPVEIKGDPFIAELMLKSQPLVITDASQDSRVPPALKFGLNPHTLVGVPFSSSDDVFGALGTGCLDGDEIRTPDPNELDYLRGVALQIAAVVGRLRFRASQVQNHARLTKIQKMENLGILASSVVHEFNNMLTIISINIGNAKNSCPPGEALTDLEIALETANRIKDLSRQLLSIGRVEDSFRELDLNEPVRRITDLIARAFNGVTVVASLEEGLPHIHGNPEKIFHVLLNLAINARDAMNSQGTITFTTASDGDDIFVSVADTGAGIEPSILDRIFEPFFTTKAYKSGSGLGLSVVQGIVEAHNGQIECKSVVGEGTTFTIYLPCASDSGIPISFSDYPNPAGDELDLGDPS